MTFEELKKIIVDTLGCDEEKVTPEATLMTDLKQIQWSRRTSHGT